MAIKIPDLDERNFQQLTNGLLSEIPKYTDQWTDFNYSDPGITIMEMLSWITETLAYRLNRVPVDTQRDFLYMLGGASFDQIDHLIKSIQRESQDEPYVDPDYYDFLLYLKEISRQVKPDSGEMRTRAVGFHRAPYLAVTQQNFVDLTLQTNEILGDYKYRVGRALVSAEDDIIYVRVVPEDVNGSAFFKTTVSQQGSLLQRTANANFMPYGFLEPGRIPEFDFSYLIQQVERFLAARTLLGAAVEVSLPTFTDILVLLEVVLDDNLDLENRIVDIFEALRQWLGPVHGGDDGQGWTYDLMPTPSMVTSFLLKTGYIRFVKVHSITVNGDLHQEDHGISMPNGQEIFSGFPKPEIKLVLKKLERRTR